MARAIPIYQRQNLAGGVQAAPNASSNVSAQSPVAAGLASIGQAAGNIGSVMAEQEVLAATEQRKKDNDIDAIQVDNTLAQAGPYFQEVNDKARTEWNTSQPDMRAATKERYDKYKAETVGKFQTEGGKKFFVQHVDRMQSRAVMDDYVHQERIRVEKISADAEVAARVDDDQVFKNPALLSETLDRIIETTNARNLTEGEKIKLVSKRSNELNLAKYRGEIARDPASANVKYFGGFVDGEAAAAQATPAAGWSKFGGDAKVTTGMIEPGNIDITTRQATKNADGSISTVRSMGVNIDGQEVLIPTVVNGKVVSDDEAVAEYKKTGKHLGKFSTPESSSAYSQSLHTQQEVMYAGKPAGGAAAPAASPGDASLPAGMRNNNPGNIKFIGQKDAVGPSKNTDQGDPQAVYASPEQGMEAMFKLALRKFDGGKVSANSLIASQGGWTPGNTAAAANVAKTMGIAPDDNLNLRDPAQLKKFARALMQQEHGSASKKYSDEMVGSVADDVLAGRVVQATTATVAPAAGAPAGDGAPVAFELQSLPGITYEQTLALKSIVDTKVKQNASVVRSQMDSSLRDEMAMNKDGIVGKKYSLKELAPYGAEAPGILASIEKSQLMATDIHSFKSQSEAEIQATLARTMPAPGPGYAAADARHNTTIQAALSILKQRNDDPAGYATKNNASLSGQQAALAAPSLSEDDRAKMTQRFVGENLAEQQRLGIASPLVLTPRQSDAVARLAMEAAKPNDSAKLIAGLEKEYGDYFPMVFNQLVKENKISGDLLIIPNIPSPYVRDIVSSLARVKVTDLTQGIDAPAQKIVKDAVVAKLADFVKTIPAMNAASIKSVNGYETTLQKMAYQLIQNGSSPGEAAKQASTLLLGHYNFDGTKRFPASVNSSVAMNGARKMLVNDLADLDPPLMETGFRKPSETDAEWRATVTSNAVWYPREKDTGLELWAKGFNNVIYRVTRGDVGVSYTWDQLAAHDVKAKAAVQSMKTQSSGEIFRARAEAYRLRNQAADGVK